MKSEGKELEFSNDQINDQIRSILINPNDNRRIEILKKIISNNLDIYVDLIKEIMLFEDDPEVRNYAFYTLSILGDRSHTSDLLEAMALETDQRFRISMIDIFKIFIKKHKISLENISLEEKGRGELVELQILSNNDKKEKIVKDNETDEIKDRIVEYIHSMTVDIPISLHRMAQVLNVKINLLESYIKDFVKEFPDAADYLKYEQVFIKNSTTLSILIDKIPVRSIFCFNCGNPSQYFPCDICGLGIQCSTCRLAIGKDEDQLGCPHCKQPSHGKHILEWLKIKGICPNCKNDLSESELIS